MKHEENKYNSSYESEYDDEYSSESPSENSHTESYSSEIKHRIHREMMDRSYEIQTREMKRAERASNANQGLRPKQAIEVGHRGGGLYFSKPEQFTGNANYYDDPQFRMFAHS